MNNDLAARTEAAFAAAREGDYQKLSQLGEHGAGIVPHLEPYIRDENEMVRLQAVALLATFDDPSAIPLLAAALGDSLQDIRARAALAFYEHYDPVRLADRAELGEALRDSVDRGNDAAAAILLLGYFPGDATSATLKALAERAGDAQTELAAWTPVVPVGLVVDISRSRLGDRAARLSLLRAGTEGTLAEREFLLSVLREVDAPDVLHALAGNLDDTSEIGGGAPSGAEPQRRLCDLAVVMFIGRLNLQVDFAVTESRRYSADEIDTVRQAIRNTIPGG